MSTIASLLSGRSSPAGRNLMTLLLSVAGGAVDAAVILRFNVLTAAQTGNTILLVTALAEHQWATGFYAAVSVVAYLLGVAAGELVMIRRSNGSRLSPAARGLLAELFPLGALLACWHIAGHKPSQGTIAVLIAFAAIAMGIQSAAVLRVHAGPTTTYVTGTLTTFATKAVQQLHKGAASQAAVRRQDASTVLLSGEGAVIYGLDWLLYAGGALASALLFLRIHTTALVLPIAAVVAAAVAAICEIEVDRENL
jgi:uncharacterized membrane protein YoaK (UPF0700 family)